MAKKHNNLRRKLFYFSMAVVLVPMITLYVVIYGFFTQRSAQENARYTYHNMQSIRHSLDAALTGLNELSLYIVANENIRNYLADGTSFPQFSRAYTSLQILPFTSKYYSSVTVAANGWEPLMAGGTHSNRPTEEEQGRADALQGASFWSVEGNSVFLVRLVRDTNRISRSLGYIKIQLNTRELADLFILPEDMPGTSYLLLTQDGVMMQSPGLDPQVLSEAGLQFDALAGRYIDGEELVAGGKTYLYSTRPIHDDKVVLALLADKSLIYQVDGLLIVSAGTALLLSAFFVFILVTYYNKRVFDPLSKLGDVMNNFEHKDLDTDFKIPGNNEIAVLMERFNRMRLRLKALHEQVYMGELRLKEAELAILQSEINPHFLYNTLDTIYWMSEESYTWRISEMVQSLANLFRIALWKTPGGLVPLSKEREYMQCYLTIQQVRYQDQISFAFYVQEGIDDLLVLKLLLQPLVENAIIHGVEPAGGGRVIINIYCEQDELVYKVFNDGAAVDVEALEAMMKQKQPGTRGLAIRNVHTRVRLKFGEGYGLHFENPPEGGVLATLRQPLIREPETQQKEGMQ